MGAGADYGPERQLDAVITADEQGLTQAAELEADGELGGRATARGVGEAADQHVRGGLGRGGDQSR